MNTDEEATAIAAFYHTLRKASIPRDVALALTHQFAQLRTIERLNAKKAEPWEE